MPVHRSVPAALVAGADRRPEHLALSRGVLFFLVALAVGAALLAVAPSRASGKQVTSHQQLNSSASKSASTSSGSSSTYKPFPPVRAPKSFVAVRLLSAQPVSWGVTVNNAANGNLEEVVLPQTWEGMTANSTAVDQAGRVWVTLSRGPRCSTPGLATCHPVPGSCASAVVRINPRTGDPEAMLEGSDNEFIEDAQPSPNGKYLAYVVAPCTLASDHYLRIRDLITGRSWTIGKRLMACQSLSSVAWSPNGKDLAIDYERSRPSTPIAHGCGTSQSGELAVVPAMRGAVDFPGRRVRMANCQADAVAATTKGYAAVEACGSLNGFQRRSGPASLVLFDRGLHVTSRTSIGACLWGSVELASGAWEFSLLGVFEHYCVSTIPGSPTPPRTTVLFTDTGSGPKTVVDKLDGDIEIYSDVSW